jgi:hypothetical protein
MRPIALRPIALILLAACLNLASLGPGLSAAPALPAYAASSPADRAAGRFAALSADAGLRQAVPSPAGEAAAALGLIYLPGCLNRYCLETYLDDFSNPGSGWPVGDADDVLTEYLDGEYRLLTRENDSLYQFRAPACGHPNYTVEVDARWEGTPGRSYGLLFGLSADASRFYLLHVNTDYGLFEVLKYSPAGWENAWPEASSAAIHAGGEANHLKITVTGSSMGVEINGVLQGTTDGHPDLQADGYGLAASTYRFESTADARFDNFRVTRLPNSK